MSASQSMGDGEVRPMGRKLGSTHVVHVSCSLGAFHSHLWMSVAHITSFPVFGTEIKTIKSLEKFCSRQAGFLAKVPRGLWSACYVSTDATGSDVCATGMCDWKQRVKCPRALSLLSDCFFWFRFRDLFCFYPLHFDPKF